jgi:hypothetical protein
MLENPQPSNVIMTAAGDQPADPKLPTNFVATMTVNIAGEPFTLSGSLDTHNIVVEYHRTFDKAVSLGSIDTIAAAIGDALHVPELSSVIGDAHRGLQQLSVLQHLLDSITSASIRITDIVINTVTNTYGVGIALDFTTSNPPLPSLFGVTLVSLGFNVTKVAKQKPAADDPPMSPDAPKP